MPPTPKQAWRTRPLGGCDMRLRTNSGAVMLAAAACFQECSPASSFRHDLCPPTNCDCFQNDTFTNSTILVHVPLSPRARFVRPRSRFRAQCARSASEAAINNRLRWFARCRIRRNSESCGVWENRVLANWATIPGAIDSAPLGIYDPARCGHSSSALRRDHKRSLHESPYFADVAIAAGCILQQGGFPGADWPTRTAGPAAQDGRGPRRNLQQGRTDQVAHSGANCWPNCNGPSCRATQGARAPG